jgi:outer membrane receptor for Fe3+-dicitrate
MWAIPASWAPVRHGLADRLCQCQGLVRCQPTQYALDASGTLSDSLSSDYRVKEDIVAAYAMATIKTGALTLVPGVRMEHTVDKAFAKVVDEDSNLTDGYNSYGRAAYTDFFPGLTARIDAARGLLFRGAVTTRSGDPAARSGALP